MNCISCGTPVCSDCGECHNEELDRALEEQRGAGEREWWEQ